MTERDLQVIEASPLGHNSHAAPTVRRLVSEVRRLRAENKALRKAALCTCDLSWPGCPVHGIDREAPAKPVMRPLDPETRASLGPAWDLE